MSLSDFLENAILNHINGRVAYTAPSAVYVALSTADPTDDGTGIAEPVGDGYARVSTTNASTIWTAAAAGVVHNNGILTFASATAAWGTITHFALFDDPSAGNMLFHEALTQSRTINNGDAPSFLASTISQTAT